MVPYHEWTNELPTLHSHLVIQKEWIFVLSKSGFNPPLKITRIILNCGKYISSTLVCALLFSAVSCKCLFFILWYICVCFAHSFIAFFYFATLLNKDKNECRICICIMQVLMILHQGIRVVYNRTTKREVQKKSQRLLATNWGLFLILLQHKNGWIHYLCGILIRFTKEFLPFCCLGVKCYE